MAFTLLSNTVNSTGTASTATTPSITTTNANLIVIAITGYNAGTGLGVTDSKGNSWTPLTSRVGNSITVSKLYYCFNPINGTGHTFTVNFATGYPSITVTAWTGARTVSGFQAESGAGNSSASTTVLPGSITPDTDGSLAVTGLSMENLGTMSISAPFAVSNFKSYVAAQNMGLAQGYYIQPTAAAVNPTWTASASQIKSASMAVFRPATQTTLVLDDAFHGHISDNLTVVSGTEATLSTDYWKVTALGTGVTLVVADTLHSHTADNLDVLQDYLLIVSDTLHGHTVDNVDTTVKFTITVQETLHAHTVDGVATVQFPQYSYESRTSLPTTDAQLANAFDTTDYSEVSADDTAYADSTGGSPFNAFVFSKKHSNNIDPITVRWKGKTGLAPTTEPVIMQIYNYNSSTWEAADSDSTTAVDTEFELLASIPSSAGNYYGPSNVVTVRVYQENT